MHRSTLPSVAALAFACQLVTAQSLASHQLYVATNPASGGGSLAVVETAPPWPATPDAAKASRDSIVRTFFGQLYVLGREDRTLRVLELPSLKVLYEWPLDHVVAPRDVAMVGPDLALISDHDAAHLWWLDVATGALTVGPDLSHLADPDGVPDVAMMEVHGGRVYVQLQRYDRNAFVDHGSKLAVLAPGFSPVPPVILESVIDLQGVRPDYRMQVNGAGTKLWVSCPGVDNDWGFAGRGIEEVSLATGQSLGFVITEDDFGADLGGFVMVDDDKGFAICHTSIIASTHFRVFHRAVGQIAELFMSPGRVESIAFDHARRQVFCPVPEGLWSTAGGVLVFDADTNQQLSGLIGIGGDPFDMIVVQ